MHIVYVWKKKEKRDIDHCVAKLYYEYDLRMLLYLVLVL